MAKSQWLLNYYELDDLNEDQSNKPPEQLDDMIMDEERWGTLET